MTAADHTLERRIADYYQAEAPPRAPDWLRERIVAAIESTPQRRILRGRSWGFPTMASAARLAAGAAAIVIVAAARRACRPVARFIVVIIPTTPVAFALTRRFVFVALCSRLPSRRLLLLILNPGLEHLAALGALDSRWNGAVHRQRGIALRTLDSVGHDFVPSES